ncbi:hypothetical protein [Microbacterium sp. 22242]|uniref:hypothetical protein n=1 Tax=Microbacterium sp. 22242 TaxID=3453896 RepID=UPI003F8639AB
MTYAAPAASAPTVPAGTPVHTRWGWVTALIPVAGVVLTIVQLWMMSAVMLDYFRQLAALIAASRSDPGVYDPAVMNGLMATMMPMWIGVMVLSVVSWGLYGLGVVAAYFDFQELGRLGYPKRFHWAWNFLSPVYPIGRAVVVQRQAGAGRATMWISIGALAASFLIAAVWTVWLVLAILGEVSALRGTLA